MDFENKELCIKCGGKCCKTLPGCYSPDDFGKIRIEIKYNLKKALRSGLTSIDCWEGELENCGNSPRFIRPATISGRGMIFHAAWPNDSDCVHLDRNTGCNLSFSERPQECRELEPGVEKCIGHYGGKRNACLLWYPYQDIINELKMELEKEEVLSGQPK